MGPGMKGKSDGREIIGEGGTGREEEAAGIHGQEQQTLSELAFNETTKQNKQEMTWRRQIKS